MALELFRANLQSDPLLLLRTLGYEVRQTLHHIQAAVEQVAGEPLSTEQAGHLATCGGEIDDLLRTANDLTELAGPDAPPAQAPFSPWELLNGIVELLDPGATRRGLKLHCAIDRATPTQVIGDRAMLEGVLFRIIDDRIKRTSRGSVEVAVRSASLGAGNAELLIEVSGDGLPVVKANEFEGWDSEWFGLEVSKKRVASLGGKLEIADAQNEMPTIALTVPVKLPAQPGSSVRIQSAAAERHENSGPLRLLVAEDADESFAVLRAYVREEGHQITRALDGVQAVEMFKNGDFDVVIMDVCMPGIDGYMATRLIREWETGQGRARLPIVLLSADEISRQKQMGGAVGCSGYLTKPTPRGELLRAVRYYAGTGQQAMK